MASNPPTSPTSLQKSTGGQAPNPSFTTKTPQLLFHDHAGNPAFMLDVHRDHTPPPHLFSFQVYVTTGLTTSTAGLLPTVLLRKLQLASPELIWIRLDVYFLPAGSSAEICMTHYRAEKDSRKTQPLHIVPSYVRHEADYVNFLIIVERADWDVTADGLNTVRFDPPKEFVSHSNEGLRVNRRVVYEVGVPVQLPKRWQEWLMANPGKVPVGQRCGESLAGSRYRVKYEERYLEEVAKMEERRGGV